MNWRFKSVIVYDVCRYIESVDKNKNSIKLQQHLKTMKPLPSEDNTYNNRSGRTIRDKRTFSQCRIQNK